MQRRATISAVAQLAGVSTATVSRVLNGGAMVSELTRERVTAAVDQLNYNPSGLTRAVFAGRSNTIGLLLADMRNPYYVDLFDGVSQVATRTGTLPYLALSNRDLEIERRMLSLMDSQRVRGLITTVGAVNEDLVNSMAQAGTECVFMARDPGLDHPRIHSVRLDDWAAGQLAWKHLAEIDRTRILVVTQREETPTRRDRVGGLVESAHEAGIDFSPENIFQLGSLTSQSFDLAKRLRDGHANGTIDAVFATTGITTFRAYEALTGTGLRVPEDIAFLGLDDFAWASYLATSLSVIRQPAVEMGTAAAGIILEEPDESQRLTFPPQLVVRGSTTLAR